MNFVFLDEEIRQLVALSKNLKKSINRQFKLETLKTKLQYANALYTQIDQNLLENKDSLTSSELIFLARAARNAITEIRFILERKINDQEIKPNMALPEAAAAVFDIRQATSLVQPYDGNAENLDSFIDSICLLNELTPEALRPMMIRFIKTRLSGKARIGLPDNIVTIEPLIEIINAKCEDHTTPENIISKLNATKQRGTINEFCEEIEKLCAKLENLYNKQQIPAAVAKTMATKAGINALTNGTNVPETKIILKAGTFASIKEAIQKATENSNTSCANASIFHYNKQQNEHRPNRGRGSFNRDSRHNNQQNHQNGRNNNRGNFRGNSRGNFRNYNNNFNNHNYRNNNYNQNGFQNRRPNNFNQHPNTQYVNSQGNNRNNPNLYFLAPGTQPTPQQGQAGGNQQIQQGQQIVTQPIILPMAQSIANMQRNQQ